MLETLFLSDRIRNGSGFLPQREVPQVEAAVWRQSSLIEITEYRINLANVEEESGGSIFRPVDRIREVQQQMHRLEQLRRANRARQGY